MTTERGRTTVLLVEDEAIIAMSEARMLEDAGFAVETVYTGEEAVEIAQERTDIAVILMDIDLGRGIDGTEAASRILDNRSLPIVFLTSHSEREMVDRVKGITRYGYLLKNSGPFVLIEAITMALELFRAHEQTRERERRIEQLNRTYQVLSDVNQTIVRARGTSELYERICNIAVDQGDFLLAWLGRPDEASGLVEPVAADREHAGHLSAVPGGLEQAEQGDPTVRAYRSGAAAVDNGSGNGEGPQSVASLPVLVFGETRLLLTLHAPLPDFFDEEELALLQELVMDLGFAIEAREHEARRIEAEEQRREWEELISYVIEHDPTAITVLDTELRHVFVSARFCEDYRVSKEDVLGRHHYEVFPEIPDRWREVHARALKGEILRSQDDRFVRLDGSVDYTRWECRPWYRRNGEIGGIVLYTEVITGLREAEERRRTVLAALEALLSASPDLVSMVDADGRYWMISDSVAEMVGRAKEEIIGRPFEDVLPPTVSEDFRRSVARVVESGSGFSKTDVVPAEDGERTYRTTLFPARETDGTVSLIGIISVELSPTGRE